MIADAHEIRKAASLLREEKLVSFPTETVYGLGGNALSDTAVAAIYAAKGRPQFNPLIVHVRSLEDVDQHAKMNLQALTLARHFWPGPLTLVLPRRTSSQLSLLVSAGLDTVAIRVPAHPLAQLLLHEAAIPIAAPSANRSGRVSPTEAAHVKEELGPLIDMILDGGPCRVGIESTVVDMTGETPIVLRPGSVTQEQLRKHLPDTQVAAKDAAVAAPGMLASHYAPNLPVRLNASSVTGDEALLAFGNAPLKGALKMENLSLSGNLTEAAANLFAMLRRLDASGAKSIAVMPVPEKELGIAINDRLTRAAYER